MGEKSLDADPFLAADSKPASHSAHGQSTISFDRPQTDRVSGGLEVRCPHCHTPTRVGVNTTLTDISCSSCGSCFSLVNRGEATHLAPAISKLGRFDLIERLGMGAFGAVWKARDKELDRTVAIKIPRAGDMTGEEQEKFFREARAAAQLRHPNIVSVHEVGRDGDSVYIVSDFVRGVTLGDWLTGQQLTNREAAELCGKIADALEHAHEQGVVHRDLKPANIMIDGDGQPHLMDFGLARRDVGEVTITMDGQVLGTPAYMSPEQAQGDAHIADRRSDVYSLGVVLFQLITGELPFRGNARMLIHQVINDEPPSPRKLNANISKDLETITLKCLEKDPSRRYGTAKDLASELRRFLAGETILARPINRVARAWRWCRRHRVAAALIGLLMIVSVAAPLVAINQATLRKEAEQSALAARRNSYVARMNMAFNLYRNGDSGRVQELLNSVRPGDGEVDLRGFEWQCLWQALHREDITLQVDPGPANDASYSPDGRRIAVVSGNTDHPNNGKLTVWDARSRKQLSEIAGLPTVPRTVQFTPDGRSVVVCSGNLQPDSSQSGDISVWDVATGNKQGTFDVQKAGISSVAISPDGKLLASAGWDKTVRLWALPERRLLRSIDNYESPVATVAFSPDGKLLASGTGFLLAGGEKGSVSEFTDGEVRIMAVDGDKPLHVFQGQWGPVNVVAFSPNGKLCAAGTGSWSSPGTVIVWDVETGSEVGHDSLGSAVTALAFPPDGKSLIGGDTRGCICVWDASTVARSNYFPAHEHYVNSIRLSPDGRSVVSASGTKWGSGPGQVKIWDVENLRKNSYFDAVSAVRCVAPAHHPEKLATGHADGSIRIWSLPERRLERVLTGHSECVYSIAWSADDTLIASGSSDRTIRLWDAKAGNLRAVMKSENNENIYSLAFSPDCTLIASCAGDSGQPNGVPGNILLWDVDAREQVASLAGHDGNINEVCFSPDGKHLFSVGGNQDHGEVFIWDVASRQKIGALEEHTNSVYSVAISNDGRLLATGAYDMTVRIWDLQRRAQVRVLKGHNGNIFSCAFSPDAKTLATGSWDQTIMLWNLATGESMATLHDVDGYKFSVEFSADGRRLFAAGASPYVAIYEGNSFGR